MLGLYGRVTIEWSTRPQRPPEPEEDLASSHDSRTRSFSSDILSSMKKSSRMRCVGHVGVLEMAKRQYACHLSSSLESREPRSTCLRFDATQIFKSALSTFHQLHHNNHQLLRISKKPQRSMQLVKGLNNYGQ